MEINILLGNWKESDKQLFFSNNQGVIDGEIVVISNDWRYPQLLKYLKIFKSTSEAKRNGWNKSIEKGFTFPFKVGKLKYNISILNAI